MLKLTLSNFFFFIFLFYLFLFYFLLSQRIPKHQWWLKLRPLLRILAKHDSTYEEEGMYITVEEELATDNSVL